MIAKAAERFDANGKLTDEATEKHIRKLLEALVEWTARLKATAPARQERRKE
jgi:hypothetical protein